MNYVSPATGHPLWPDTPHSLKTSSGERWPVVDGIAYLRIGSEALALSVLRLLDDGDFNGALVLLLAENDRWWTEPPPPPDDLAALVRDRDTLTLRDAMALLGFGRVGTYFAHRWSDPTFMAGLALVDTHWAKPATAFDLACGIGHYVRALDRQGVTTVGADIVFSKLWVARHWVVGPRPTLVCFDVDGAWPVTQHFDLVTCHDAFYFFADKVRVAENLKACAGSGQLVVGHIHNAAAPQFQGGTAVALPDLQRMFPGACIYDDDELTRAAAAGAAPQLTDLAHTEAFGLVYGHYGTECVTTLGPLCRPAHGVRLVRNPLCAEGAPRWPSERYKAEYAPRATYTCAMSIPDQTTMGPQWAEAVARRDLLDLPERW